MDVETTSKFGVIDYCMFGGMLAVTGVIGLRTAYIGNKSPEEFLMGNRDFSPLPVALSLLTTYVSSISLLGYTGEVYANGLQVCTTHVGAILAILCSSFFVMPVLYPLNITSITEYIEMRFKSKTLRQTISTLKLLKTFFAAGVTLFSPTIALVAATNLDTLTYIFLLGILCTLYSSFGGIRAVVWTDVFQLTVMLAGMIVVVTAGCYQNGGLIKTLNFASEGGRLDIFEMSLSPFIRHTFFNTLTSGFFVYADVYSSYQINVQRLCTVKSLVKSKRVLRYNVWGLILICFLMYTGGLAAFAAYYGCDPLAIGTIKRKEEIMPYFIADKLRFVPGLHGLFIATLLAGSLSSLSSMVNSEVALIWKDVCLRFSFFQRASLKVATLTNKILSLMVGVLLMGLAILASRASSIIELYRAISGTFIGPVFGVYFIGYFLPKCNLKGVWTGAFASFAVGLWLSVGSVYYKKAKPPSHFLTDKCQQLNNTAFNSSTLQQFILQASTITTNSSSSIPLPYQISYTLLVVIGPVTCVLLAIIVSFLTGNQRLEEISPKLICPSVRRFYWTKEELEFLQETELRRLDIYDDINVNDYVSKTATTSTST